MLRIWQHMSSRMHMSFSFLCLTGFMKKLRTGARCKVKVDSVAVYSFVLYYLWPDGC